MKFEPRTTKPEKGNKYYIRKADGGYSDAIEGKPTDPDCNVLANCFAAETRFVTDEGLKSFAETVGTVQNVLNVNGEFVPAEVKSFGKQKLVKVTFDNNKTFYTTEGHLWLSDRYSFYEGKKYFKRVEKPTTKLNRNDYIPYNYFKGNDRMSVEGIVHGIVFGDGRKNTNCATYQVQLFGEKKELKQYLPEHIYGDNLKSVPSIDKSEEYLRGFVAGLFATDGHASSDSRGFSISNISLEALQKIEDICYKVGIVTNGIRSETRDVKIGKYEYKNHTIHMLKFKRRNIEKILIRTSHLKALNLRQKYIDHTHIKSVEPTDRFEEVLCVVEPQTHTFTLEGNILTKNCSGYSYGRFNEVGQWGYCKYLAPVNAGIFMDFKGDCASGFDPKLGACMVWRKDGSSSSGHVASVEAVIDNDTVITSESSYNGQAFYLKTRHRKDGNWEQNGYTFKGFIYNPAVEDELDWQKSYLDLNAKYGDLEASLTKMKKDLADAQNRLSVASRKADEDSKLIEKLDREKTNYEANYNTACVTIVAEKHKVQDAEKKIADLTERLKNETAKNLELGKTIDSLKESLVSLEEESQSKISELLETNKSKKGDVNGDGKVNLSDLFALITIIFRRKKE